MNKRDIINVQGQRYALHVILGFPIWWYVAFYAGWPKAWAVFNLSKEEYGKLNN